MHKDKTKVTQSSISLHKRRLFSAWCDTFFTSLFSVILYFLEFSYLTDVLFSSMNIVNQLIIKSIEIIFVTLFDAFIQMWNEFICPVIICHEGAAFKVVVHAIDTIPVIGVHTCIS